jgi:hypothetical protein
VAASRNLLAAEGDSRSVAEEVGIHPGAGSCPAVEVGGRHLRAAGAGWS